MHILRRLVLQGKKCATLKKSFTCVAMAMAITISSIPVSFADIYGYTAVQATVIVNSGKVRKEADAQSAFVFGVTKDEVVTVIGETKGTDGATWYQIKVLGSTGYIRSDLLKKSNIEVKSESTIEITDDSNAKKEENSNKDTSDKKAAETSDNKEDKPSESTNSKTETKTESADKAANTETASNKSPVVKGSNVIVRENASTKSAVRIMVQKGLPLNVISTEKGDDGKDWLHVSFSAGTNNYEGYIRSDLVNMEGAVATSANNTDEKKNENTEEPKEEATEEVNNDKTATNGEPPTTQIGKVRGMGVNIRKEPVSGKVIARLNTGSQITVVDQVRGQADMNIWCKINFIDNQTPMTGYIRSDFTDGIKLHVTGEPAGEDYTLPKPDKKGTTSENPPTLDENGEEKPENNENKQENKDEKQENEIVKTASIKGTGVRIRESAVDGNIICQLDTGYPITILEEMDASDGYKWYKIEFSKNDKTRVGYVRSDLVNVTITGYTGELADEDFENQISEFPEDYKAQLRGLHEKYPNWRFEPVNTGLDWNNVVAAETVVGKNLVAKSSIASWKSTAPQAYNWASNTWYGFDGGSWAAASPELIKYYLDPRNFLDDSGVFQFETLNYQDYQNEGGVANICASTFMQNEFTDTDGATRTYPSVFMEAGQTYGISPYHLASRCVQEQGAYGTSQSISGSVSGLENIFNYFNIGAFAANGRSATINGLYYAAGYDEDNLRPWNSRYKSIMGAAKYISTKYISHGQNTLYFQKFNVVNKDNGLYSHQYMSNVVAASAESARLRRAYSSLDTTLVFRIPIYSNMPSLKCAKPTSDSNPNTYLSSLSIDGCEFTTPFSSVTNTYYTTVDASVEAVNVNATAVSASSSISGSGIVALNMGENKIQVTCKAQNGSTKIYTIVVKRG